MSIVITAICFLIVGMACPFVAFLIFKPVLIMYINAMNMNKRLTEDGIAERVLNRMTITPNMHEKAAKKGVLRPKRDTDGDDV